MTSNFTYRYLAMTPEHVSGTGVRNYGTASALNNTDKSGSTTDKVFGEVDDESIQYRFELLTRGDMSRYSAAKSVNGKEYSEGGINFVAQPDDLLGLCLYGIYGDDTTNDPPSGAGYTVSGFVHTMKENKANILPSFTLEVGREAKEHTYTGMCINRLGISAAHGEYTTLSVDFVGKRESALGTLVAAPTYSGVAVDGFHFAEGEIKFSEAGASGVASTKIKSISIDFNMNLDTDAACAIGDRTYLRQPEPQMREITGTVEFSEDSTTGGTSIPSYEMLIAEGGKLYDGVTADPAIKLHFTNGTQQLVIGIRKVRWEAPTSNVSGRDTQTLSLNFVALVDTADDIMSETVLTLTAASSNLATATKYSQI